MRTLTNGYLFGSIKSTILISKAEIKFISSLGHKKYRDKHDLFIAETPKVVSEFYEAGFKLHSCFADMAVDLDIPATPISDRELKRISQLTNAHGCLAVFEKPPAAECDFSGLILALDGVRDPGNLGTIVRLCDWFGVGHLLCSFDTVDCYNPKVVQASMGSLARVAVHYVDLEAAFGQREMPVYASDMHAPSVYETKLSLPAILVMGNEGQGISKAIMDRATQRIAIPSYGEGQSAESLNVAAATAILLGEFRRSTER